MARRIFKHPVLTLEGFDVQTRGGPKEFVRLRMPDWVNVVPITADGEVVLVRQHRWGVDRETLEIPGGCVDAGESPEQAALRELVEETGYGGGTLQSLGFVWSNPAIQDNRTHLFVARGVRPVAAPSPDEAEEITVELHPLSALPALLDNGRIRHALAVVSLERLLRSAGDGGGTSWGSAGPR